MAPKKITFEVSRGALVPDMGDFETIDAEGIDEHGAKGLWDGFGTLQIIVNGTPALILAAQKERGELVIAVSDPNQEFGPRHRTLFQTGVKL